MKSKAKNTPEVAKMLESYHKQEHRLAFNGCEMTYNDKPFRLGMTIKEVIKLLGQKYSFHRGVYIWKDIGAVFSTNKDKYETNEDILKKITYIYIYMNTEVSEEYKESLKHELNYKNDYFLLEGMPIDKNMRVMDFIANSYFELNDFGISNYGYELDYNCNGKKIGYRLEADGLWLRKGVGHLTYKDKPNPENKNVFEMLYITEFDE
ncbi:DUF7738 domain-containing protein [Tenacibaculum sp. IMCC1]